MGDGAHAGTAKRRRERRLRAMLRHERMTVAMVLSEKKHHTSRGQRKDRTTGEEYVMNYTAKLRKTPLPKAAATKDYPMALDVGGELAAGERPDALFAPWPHGKVERHSGIGYELVLALDAPVLQMVEQPVVDVFARYAIQVPKQVIEVPKILIDVIPARSLVPEPQVVEQLVDVPTVLTPTRIALQIAEQLVDIPVPQVSVSGGGHQGSLSGQGSVGEQIVDIPSGVGLGQGSSSSAGSADEDFPGGFRTFPHGEKVRSAGQVSADLPRHVSSSTPVAQPVSWWASLTPAQWAELRTGQGGSEEGAREQEEEEEEEEEAAAEVLCATSSSFQNSHSEIWTLLYEPFVLAFDFFLTFYVLDSDPEVVPDLLHSSTLPWYLAATGSVFALPGIYRKIGFSARRLQSLFPTSPLYLAVTLLCLVLPLEKRTMDFPGDDSRNGFRTQHSSV